MIIQMLQNLKRLHEEQVENTGRRNSSFMKSEVNDADFYKPVLNKIMAIHK